ncbi:MAG: ABC-2 family transporter protein [Bacteroidetes bacterium]|nr:ABC-2 family transporter protein [Bacteroidota bacterium]
MMFNTLRSYLGLLGAYMSVNWRSALEYRTNFVFETLLSIIEVGMYLFYWKIFFTISSGIPGATYQELVALVAFNHVIYAGADTLMGNNVWDAGEHIVKGRLDIFLTQPKSAIYQLFFSGAQPMRAVQILVGATVFFVAVGPAPGTVVLFIAGTIAGTSIFTSWVILVQALTFRLGNITLIYKLLSVILHFSKKPAAIFSAAVRFVLYTIIPAAFVGSVQARQLFHPTAAVIAGLLGLAAVAPVIAVLFFRRMMRHYESGNLVGVRI